MSFSVQPELVELATRPPSERQRRLVVLSLLLGVAGYIGLHPFAEVPVSPVIGVVEIQSAGLAVTNLLAALLLIGQLQLRRSLAVRLLSFGYLISSGAACAYTLLFPELISVPGSITNSQINDWLYLSWHGAFSLCVLGYALASEKSSRTALGRQIGFLMLTLVGAAIGLRMGLEPIVPALAADQRTGGLYYAAICAVLSISLLALVALLGKRPRSLLDAWLSVAMLAWIFDVALAASFDSQSFDLGFYVGRLCGLLGSLLVLALLGIENLNVHARLRSAFDAMIASEVRQKSNELLAAVLRNLPDGIFVFDGDQNRPIVNERGMALIRQRTAGKDGSEGGHGVMDLVLAQAARAIEDGAFEDEIVEGAADGERRVFSVSASAIQDSAGSLAARVVVINDVTERVRADQVRRQYLERLNALLENTPLAAIEWGLDRIVRRWSKRAEELFGWSAAEAIGQSMDTLQLIHPEDAHTVSAIADALVGRSGACVMRENRNVTRDGRVLQCAWYNSALRDEHGEVVATFSLALDITERKQAMAQLEDADRRKDVFIATLAHELRNPLAPIANAASLLLSHQTDPERVAWLASMIGRQGARMGRLLEDLLDVSRIGRGKIQLRLEMVELTGLVHEALQTSLPLMEAARHHVRLELPSVPVWINADPVRIAQIMSNLMNNAAKYTPPGGAIDVQLATAGDTGIFTVADNGIGIESDMLPQVFEAFVQVGSARHLAQGGLGIGLSLAQGLAQLHGGSLAAASEGAGRGSVFTLRLPLAPQQHAPPGLPAAEPPGSMLETTILVADDNVDAADSLAMLLRARGAHVSVAYDGEQALQEFKEHPTDIVILDLGMPRLDGLEAAARLAHANPRPFLVALTGRGRKEDRTQSLEAGFDEHLIKPVDLDQLSALLLRVTANLRAR